MRPVRRFAQRPVDPRCRRVVGKLRQGGRGTMYLLDCGHEMRRKLMCEPTHLICTHCPPAGGHGGTLFQK